MELQRRPFGLTVCVQAALNLVAPRAAEKGLRLTCEIGAAVPGVITSDSTRLRQILLNLLQRIQFSAPTRCTDSASVTPSSPR